jgi:hypothetical protein
MSFYKPSMDTCFDVRVRPTLDKQLAEACFAAPETKT